ncbi:MULTISPECIES: carboxylating nicotinate-nucleotide diphosphorylase [Aerococcus]|uniref:nicotinate-nucleotide diphosphorylase (carboxylating) n=2 Tax=Aerococcus TaxID=1375 RepID=A0ABT4C0H7_9LACT|nr:MULTISPECIES: carboxylating nicotinate-nucleotide diphosphorylase [Aerococcus]KAA9218772.1 carboxylating nicotinate-nucleotide diphosphorylase [Aerococcus loyolae]MCY3026007.1 carboxylating nicotinate-nucleotide diphosphorylase [Aerococcus loyolae]MCY3027932.1 carboxylating nicotinate-nucleotide diphosphorylase [Aerococcus loyolae]MCY3029560.1 carboxylating nicotinate-nucleotide diphosphorylase [Aerococcus loyolae]MDK6232354.1 carboxylating nicotinate-nucleotide diphosphorylase [Aerococcus 
MANPKQVSNFINLNQDIIDELITLAFKEDIPYEDLSTNAIYQGQAAQVELLAKEAGVICGLDLFKRVFLHLDPEVQFESLVRDGDRVANQETLMVIKASVNTLLSGERIALNFLQRMSGIATATRRFVDSLEGSGIKLLDTRKTTPAYRPLEKYAVRVGGGYNHRYSLSDQIMLKDNHVAAAGGVKEAIQAAKAYAPFVKKIEIEVEDLDMVRAAVEAGADIIMLDNMDHDTMEEAIAIINGQAIIEASGNFTWDNVTDYKDLAIDYISSGAITHSAGILDLSLKHLKVRK